MRTRVFVLEPCKQVGQVETDALLAQGDIVYVFPHGTRRAPMLTSEYRDEFLSRLTHHRYDPEVDIFVCSGPNVPVLIVSSHITAHYGRWRALVWDSRDQSYVEIFMGATRQETGHAREVEEALRSSRRA